MRRGFVITMGAILLLTVLLLMPQSNQKRLRESNKAILDSQSIDSAAYFFDDVACDMRSILGPVVEMSRNSSHSNITFREQLPRNSDESSLLSNYSSFLGNYSEMINSNVSLNFSGISNEAMLVFSNGLKYDRNSTSLRFHSSGKTNASAYELYIFSNGYRTSENLSSLAMQSGTLNLSIHYSDLNGSIEVNGSINPDLQSIYSVNYDNGMGVMRITAGSISGSSGSIGVETELLQVLLNLTATGEWNSSLAYAYNANMSYRQLNVEKDSLLWVEEG